MVISRKKKKPIQSDQTHHTRPIMSHFHSTRTLTNPNVDNHNAAIFITDIFICELIYIFVII